MWYKDCMSMSHSRHDDGTTGIFDTGATLGVATEKAKKALIPTGENFKKCFSMPMVDTAADTDKMNMDHKMRDPATEMHVVPGVQAIVVSESKMADSGYVTILDKNYVKIYDGNTTKVSTDQEPLLQGYRCKQTGLWHIPLTDKVSNENIDTNLVYLPIIGEAIENCFELPSLGKKITYYHAECGYSMQSTWIKAIKKETLPHGQASLQSLSRSTIQRSMQNGRS